MRVTYILCDKCGRKIHPSDPEYLHWKTIDGDCGSPFDDGRAIHWCPRCKNKRKKDLRWQR